MTRSDSFTVSWTLFLRAATPRAAAVILGRIAKVIGAEFTDTHTERYWKDPRLMRTTATTSLGAGSIESAVFEVLRLGQGIGGRWRVTALEQDERGQWSFRGEGGGGPTDSTSISGLTLIIGEIRNDEPIRQAAPDGPDQP